MAVQVVAGVEAPAITPPVGGLLDVATVVEGLPWPVAGSSVFGDLFTSNNCPSWQIIDGVNCFPEANGKKQFTTVGRVDGYGFTAYQGVECGAVGLAASLDEVTKVFKASESLMVEKAMMAKLAGAGAIDLTPSSGGVSPKVALALLEQAVGCVYAGVPTIHVTRSVGSILMADNAIVRDGDRFMSRQGSKIASGVGYDCPNVDPTGTDSTDAVWLYATGEVLVQRGELITREVISPGDVPSGMTQSHYSQNSVYMLAERPYIVAYDCVVAAIKTDTPVAKAASPFSLNTEDVTLHVTGQPKASVSASVTGRIVSQW